MSNKFNLSIVIPSIGEDFLFNTLKVLNSGNHLIDEILIIIPKKYKKKEFIDKDNYKFIFTDFDGQVKQRIYGFSLCKNDIIMQLDCDCEISNTDVFYLYNTILKIGPNNCIAPVYFTKDTKTSIHKFPDKFTDIPRNIFTSLICGSDFNVMRMGTISKIGNNFGADPEYMVNDMLKSDWLPGGCVVHYKSSLILQNYYPFKGKAYCEDLIHCFHLRNKNVELWISKKASCYTEKPELPRNNVELNNYYRSFKYFNKLIKSESSNIRFYIWLTFSRVRSLFNSLITSK